MVEGAMVDGLPLGGEHAATRNNPKRIMSRLRRIIVATLQGDFECPLSLTRDSIPRIGHWS
jgi:hypothetical protein